MRLPFRLILIRHNNYALKIISGASMKEEKPAIAIGDTVKVHCKIKEGDKERIQIFDYVPRELLERYHSEIERVFGAGSCYVLRLREQGAVRVG